MMAQVIRHWRYQARTTAESFGGPPSVYGQWTGRWWSTEADAVADARALLVDAPEAGVWLECRTVFEIVERHELSG